MRSLSVKFRNAYKLRVLCLGWTGSETFLRRSVGLGTQKTYRSLLKSWQLFRGRSGNVWLAGYSNEAKVLLVVQFCEWLVRVEERRGAAVAERISALGTELEIRGHGVEWLKDLRVVRAKKAAAFTVAEIKAGMRKKKDTKLPLSGSMVRDAKSFLWTQSWGVEQMLRKAAWLSLCLGMDSGLRVSQFTVAEPGAEDHCICVMDCQFMIRGGGMRPGGRQLWRTLRSKGASWILGCDLDFVTHKKVKVIKGGVTLKTIERRSEWERVFLDCFVEWLVRADAEGEDELFTVRTGRSIATLRRKEVNVVIKEVAVANGLPAKNFSSKSLRGGFSTQCDREGVSRGVSNVRGMWAQGSRVQEGHYLSQVGGEGVMAMGTGKEMSVTELRRLAQADARRG